MKIIGMEFQGDAILTIAETRLLPIMAGLLVHGLNSSTEVDLMKNNHIFMNALNLKKILAPATVRINLDRLVANCQKHVLALLDDINLNLLKSVIFSLIETEKAEYRPVDIDLSLMYNSGSNKEGGY